MQFCSEPGCSERVNYGRCTAHRRQVADDNQIHKWYCSKRWRDLRRDVIRAQPFCVSCYARGLRVLTEEVDHIRRHDGDPSLFWDLANLQGRCKPCHSRKTSRGE